jgi:hypothetical protein
MYHLYFIQRPIDLSSIENKLNTRQYRTKQKFVSDFHLMFNNCRLYNGPGSGE